MCFYSACEKGGREETCSGLSCFCVGPKLAVRTSEGIPLNIPLDRCVFHFAEGNV
jgi:hypothetical protein